LRLVVFSWVPIAISLGSSRRALCFLPLAFELALIPSQGLFLFEDPLWNLGGASGN